MQVVHDTKRRYADKFRVLSQGEYFKCKNAREIQPSSHFVFENDDEYCEDEEDDSYTCCYVQTNLPEGIDQTGILRVTKLSEEEMKEDNNLFQKIESLNFDWSKVSCSKHKQNCRLKFHITLKELYESWVKFG